MQICSENYFLVVGSNNKKYTNIIYTISNRLIILKLYSLYLIQNIYFLRFYLVNFIYMIKIKIVTTRCKNCFVLLKYGHILGNTYFR